MKKLILILAALPLAACSIGVKSDETPAEPINTFAHEVAGPDISGNWESGCVDTGYRSKVISLTVKAQDITRTTQNFSDRACANATDKTTYPGKFRYKSVVRKEGNDSVFLTDWELVTGTSQENGMTVTHAIVVQENIKPTPSVLYVSDYRTGDAPADIPLVRKVAQKPVSADVDASEIFDEEF